jgi:hypothetical protein
MHVYMSKHSIYIYILVYIRVYRTGSHKGPGIVEFCCNGSTHENAYLIAFVIGALSQKALGARSGWCGGWVMTQIM